MRLKSQMCAPIRCCFVVLCCAIFCVAAGHAQTIDETYKQALKEGGVLNVYGTLTPDTADKVLPVFEKRFPGIKAVNTGASGDKIVARAISEARGGRTIGDVFHMNLENVMQVQEQGLVLEKLPPEAEELARAESVEAPAQGRRAEAAATAGVQIRRA